MNKITPDHLARNAYIYIRQSTADQLSNNPESRRRQYALKGRAEALGWRNVVIIDDDLGRSGGGVARKGFERLLVAVGDGSAGAVLAIEASRLARNGRDWHTLLELCGLVGCILIDEDGIYDPRSINDRLLLGMKGTFSELELSILRQRSQEALRLKASRGDLHTSVAIGYLRSSHDRLEMDPDRRIREALDLVFRKFDEIGSVRQVALWLRQEGVQLPTVARGALGRIVEWRLPRYNSVHRILTNPVYGGAYVFGRTASRTVMEAGRKVVKVGVRRRPEEWGVLIPDHHEGYITWQQYERNQRLIGDNANMKGAMVPGSVRNGGGFQVGLLRCVHCGRKRLRLATHGRIERIADAVPGITYRRLIQATGRCPPKDVGGPWGYRDFLAAMADPDHEQHAETLTRVAEPFDPATADAKSHARAIAALAKRWARSPSTGRKRSN